MRSALIGVCRAALMGAIRWMRKRHCMNAPQCVRMGSTMPAELQAPQRRLMFGCIARRMLTMISTPLHQFVSPQRCRMGARAKAEVAARQRRWVFLRQQNQLSSAPVRATQSCLVWKIGCLWPTARNHPTTSYNAPRRQKRGNRRRYALISRQAASVIIAHP